MRWASGLGLALYTSDAVREAAEQVVDQMDGQTADLILVFASPHHQAAYNRVPALLQQHFPDALVLGSSGGAIIGAGREIEDMPAVSITAAALPGVELRPFHIDDGPLPDAGTGLADFLGIPQNIDPHFIVLPEPTSFDPAPFLVSLDATYPSGRTVGGLSSGGREAGANAIFLNDLVARRGLTGVALSGNVVMDTVVAQGCRPIGQPMFVTKSHNNMVYELDGRSALDTLKDLYEELPRPDQELARHSLFLGLVMATQQQEYHQGDFLIRNLMGMDPERGALAVGALIEPNIVVQFHLRDRSTSTRDLRQVLSRYEAAEPPAGALLFSCLGRGQGLYGTPNHDSDLLRERFGDVPLGGFFCNGEIGPVRGATHLHGYTSAFGLFRPKVR